MTRAGVIALFLGLWSCGQDETISGYADRTATYRLSELNGQTFAADASISFPEKGRIEGRGPCNTYTAQQSAPYPWIDIGPIAATKMACPELERETAFFAALDAAAFAEVGPDLLILSNDDGGEMVFVPAHD